MRGAHFKIFLTSWIILIHSIKVNAQAYNFDFLNIQNGLPQSQAFDIAFDDNQYAWIGTQGGGLCRFDGNEFLYLTKKDSLISNRVYTVTFADNLIWAGQKGGITAFTSDGTFVNNYRLPGFTAQIQDIVSFQGKIYAASNEGLYCIEKGELIKVTVNPNLNDIEIFSFFQSDSNQLWMCTTAGLVSHKNVFGKLTVAKGLTSNNVQCAVRFHGNWIIGTYGGGLNSYSGNQISQLDEFASMKNEIILSLFVRDSNELWIGTMNNGIYLYDHTNGSLRNFRTTNGLSGNHIKTIVADHWDNIWIGTSGGGVSIFQNSPFIEYNSASGLNGDYVFSVLHDSKQNLWLGTEGTGVMRINDTSKVLFDEELGFYSEKVKSIFEDSKGNIWFGTEGKGLGFYSASIGKDTIFAFSQNNGLGGNWIKAFAEDTRSNRLYIGSADRGIYYTDPRTAQIGIARFKKLKVDKDLLGLSDLLFYNGKLWYVTEENTFGFVDRDGNQIHFSEHNRSFRNIIGKDTIMWLGTKDNGILKITMKSDEIVEKNWITEDNFPGLQSNNIYQLLMYDDQIWVGTEKGLDRWQLDSVNGIQDYEHFGYADGFEGVETNINAGNVDKEGNLWFGTVNGLYVYKGIEPNLQRQRPPVLKITDFRIVFESISATPYASSYDNGQLIKGLILPYDENHISFSFKAVHHAFVDKIRYRWRLEGVEDNWNPATRVNVATYPNLTPGDYKFLVQAAINDEWNQAPLQISFTIDYPYWQKLWFKSLYISAIALLLFIVLFVIYRRQKRKNQAIKEKLTLEKNLLELEQKALRLQMNPHFIFNVLNSIHNQIILNDSGKARYALSKFSKLMRQVLENSREKFISIDDEIETLKNYVQLERLTSGLEVDLSFEFGEDVDQSEPILPPLMIQPFVENAIIHGFKGMTVPGQIKVSFNWLFDDVLECTIEDNGIGRAKAGELKAQQEAHHKSTALKVAQERLANLNQNSKFNPFEIIDLYDDKKKPMGTKVIIRIAL